MEFASVNATKILEFGESVQVSAVRTVELTVGELSARFGFSIPSDAILEAVLLLTLLLCALLCGGSRVVRQTRAQKRARENKKIVAIASNAPEDDGDEHELERHSHARGATPGDSDVDEELCTPRSHAPASACP